MQYLEKATTALSKLGIVPKEDQHSPIAGMLQELAKVDENSTLVIARTLQKAELMNTAVRSQVADMQLGTRYEGITLLFDSIITDTQTRVKQIDDGKLTFGDKVGNLITKVRRGSITSRFDKVRKLYLDVAKDTQAQLEREKIIERAYLDYRSALKEAEVIAAQMEKKQKVITESALNHLKEVTAAVSTAPDAEAKAKAQNIQAEAQQSYDTESSRYNLINVITLNLTQAYNVGDVVITKLHQITEVKTAVFQQAVTFFTTNESVFTSLDATLTALAGLQESHRALDAMKSGISKSMKVLAEESGKTQMAAIHSAYGATIDVESVKALLESTIKFKTDSQVVIQQLRKQSAENNIAIADVVEKGKARYVALISSERI